MKKYIIISHSHCTDGLCSASLMKKALQLAYGSDTKINVVFASYGKEEDALSKLNMDTESNYDIFIVDFSFSTEQTISWASKADNLSIIDHHITAVEKLKDIDKECKNVKFIFDNNMSGATLALKFIQENIYSKILDFENAKIVSKLVEDRDLWKFNLENTKPFGEYIFSNIKPNDIDAFSKILFRTNHANLKTIFKTGKAIQQYKEKQVYEKLSQLVEPKVVNLFDIDFIVVNETQADLVSEFGNAICKKFNMPVCLYKIINEDNVSLSFRSMDNLPDISVVAKNLGGGGHRNACGAGYTLNQLSLLLESKSDNEA